MMGAQNLKPVCRQTKIKTQQFLRFRDQKFQSGAILTLVLIFSAVFLLSLSGVIGFVLTQYKHSQRRVARLQALEIAEAGLNYYRWILAHDPENYKTTTSLVKDYYDPAGGLIGKFELNIIPPTGCVPAVRISSTGWTTDFPNLKRTVKIRYAQPALAKYAFLTNSNVWFGDTESLKGPFHSNGGIRMDGDQNALSTSAKETYICGAEHGCTQATCSSPCQWTVNGCECPGIWGQGSGQSRGLWLYPVPAIDFAGITRDLAQLKDLAQTSGIYLPQLGLGYHIIFQGDKIDIYRVTQLENPVWGFDGEKWVRESNDIKNETAYQLDVPLPDDCAPIFVEDNVWVDGVIDGRATLVAARLPDSSSNNAKIIINGNITYATDDSVLGLIGQKDILIPLKSPDDLTIQAALLAQKGHVFRYYYPYWPWEPYRTYAIRNRIQVYGSIITNTIWTFSWVNNLNQIVSGYQTTETSYDSNLTYNPPPYFPTAGQPEVMGWEEVE